MPLSERSPDLEGITTESETEANTDDLSERSPDLEGITTHGPFNAACPFGLKEALILKGLRRFVCCHVTICP